jgi:hypothetical protein
MSIKTLPMISSKQEIFLLTGTGQVDYQGLSLTTAIGDSLLQFVSGFANYTLTENRWLSLLLQSTSILLSGFYRIIGT